MTAAHLHCVLMPPVIEDLDLSPSLTRRLRENRIVYIDDLVRLTAAEFLKNPVYGKRDYLEIEEALKKRGLYLGMNPWPPDVDPICQRPDFQVAACPHCKTPLCIDSISPFCIDLTSIDWSDGYIEFPYFFHFKDSHPISRCPVCSGLFFNDEMSPIDPDSVSVDKRQKHAHRPPHSPQPPTVEDYITAIRENMPRSEREELTFRQTVWHMANHRIRPHIDNVTNNQFWMRPRAELSGYVKRVEQFFVEYDKLANSKKYTHENGLDQEALLRDVIVGLRQEAPEFLAGDGASQLEQGLAKGLTEEEEAVFVAFASTASLEFPDVPDEIRGLYEVGKPRSEVRSEIRKLRKSINESLDAIQQFQFTRDELACLSGLSALLQDNDQRLLIELLRETDAFDLALAQLERNQQLWEKTDFPVDELRWACGKRLRHVFMVGKATELSRALSNGKISG